MSFVKFPPVTTGEAIAVLKQDTMLLHDIVHGDETAEVLTENGLVPSVDKMINDINGRVEAAIEATGWFVAGDFATGFVFTARNQVGRDASGEMWSYNGELPFTVAPATIPASPLYTQRGDAALRSGLAAADSTVLVGGVEAGKFPLRYNNVAEMQSGVGILDVGKTVEWLGYYAPLDGGDGWGIVKSGSYVPDGGKIIGIGSGLYVEQDVSGSSLSVKKYGVRGDGVTDDTVQFQRCLNSGEPSIFVPEGVYILGLLTFPDWITVEGVGYQPSVGGGTRTSELRFSITSGQSAITCGSNPTIRKLFLINVGGSYNESTKTLSGTAAAAIKLNENAVIEECGFWLWYDCIKTGASTFYLRTSKLHFNRCTFGYTSEGTSPYDMHIDAPHSALTEVFIRGVGDNTPRNTKIFGGSIEGYSVVAQRFLDIAFFGTYFESEPERTVFAAIDPQLDESTVSLFGCTIFMNRTSRFVNMSGLARVGLTSSGNTFAGAATVGSSCFYLPASGSVSLAGDKIESSIMTNTVYIDSVSQGLKLGGIRMPLLQTGNAQVDYSELSFTGERGAIGAILSAAPANKVSGQMILANGSSWDPLSLSAGRPYYVIWQGDRWRGVSG